MTRLATGTIFVALFLFPIIAGAGEQPAPSRPDFSGKWALDLGRSRLNPEYFGDLTSGVVRIKHHEPAFSFRRAFTRGGESEVVKFTLTTDGKEVGGTEDGMPTRSSIKWSGSDLLYLTVYTTPRGEARNTVKYTLTDGGRTLRAEESFRGPRLSYDNVWVFSKAE